MNEKLNIQDLIDLLAEKHGMSKKNADSFVKEFFQLIEEALEKDKYVKIKGLGAFKLIDVESRESVNVNTGERFEIQGHTKVSFTPEPALKDIINKPFAHFETVVLNEGTVLEDTPVDSGSEEDEDTEQKVEDVVPEVVAGSTVEIPEIAEKNDSPVESEPVEETVAPVETVASEEVNEERVEVIKTAGPAESSAMKYFIAIVALVVLLCAGTVAYLYYPDWFDGLSAEQPVEETAGNEAGNEAGNTALMDSVGGNLVYGHDGFAGELGHVIMRRNNGRQCGCGRQGCLEAYASATGVARTAREYLEIRKDESVLRDLDPDEITSKDVYDAAMKNDKIALEIFEATGSMLGEAFADFVAFSSPEAIILFGGLTKAGDLIMNPIKRSMEKNMLKVYAGKTKLLFSQLKESDAAVLGASALGWEVRDQSAGLEV